MTQPLKSRSRYRRALIIGTALTGIAVTPSWALFGFGDIVFDPQSYATLGKIWTSEADTATKMAESITQAKKLYANAVQTYDRLTQVYDQAHYNLGHFNAKTAWETARPTLAQLVVSSYKGETAGWSEAINTDSPVAASTAWKSANLQVDAGNAFANQTPGLSSHLSSMAMIEAFDASSPACLNSLGQYRAMQGKNLTAENALEAAQFDGTDATNSEIEQLNLLNASGSQQMHQIQAQGLLQACLAEQSTVSNMAQRNAAAAAINDASFAQQERIANNANPANESNTWQSFLP